jgi:ATP-dependent Lon protease
MPDEEVAKIPDQLPIMVLNGASLFPHAYMPLFIFEQRYRDMLSHVLDGHRMFCVGHARPGIDHENHPDPVLPITTVGLVRACVTHEDGTSHLMLSGVQRVEITGWLQNTPFRIASIQPKASRAENLGAVVEASQEVVDLCSRLCGADQPMSDQLRQHLRGVKDPEAISDVVAQTFVSEPRERQYLIETLDIMERLQFLSHHLSQQLAKGQS